MHKQLPTIILIVVIIAAIIGMFALFKTPSYGEAITMPQTIARPTPASQPAVYTQTAVRTVTSTAPRRIQSSELTRDFYDKLSLECQQKTKQLYTELYKKAHGSSVTGMQGLSGTLNSPLFDEKIITTIALIDVELRPGTTLSFGCGADIGLQDLMSGNFNKGTYGISIDFIGLW